MRIVYFYQYFSTSEGAWGTRVYEFSKNWVKMGHCVTVVTSIYSKSDLKAEEFVSTRLIDGIEVKVINVLIDNRQPLLKRIWTFIQYALVSSWYAITLEADVVIASSGPITVGIPGLIAKWFRSRRLIFEARDLWPEGAVEMGVIRNSFVIKLAYWFERICYKNSFAIIGLSPGIQKSIKDRFPKTQVFCITNAANIELFATPQPYQGLLNPQSYALYFGNIGHVNHSGYLLDAAKSLLAARRDDIQILLIGEGQLKQELIARAKAESLTNVTFLDLMPKSVLVGYIQQAFASIIPLKPMPVFDTSSPNKLFESLAAGVPVIQTTQGWIKQFIETHNVGFNLDGNVPQQLADTLILLKDHPDVAMQMRNRAGVVAAKYFNKDYLAGEMLAILKSTHEAS
jgi:glycosyltransferase involved in cell wall biosynthesis